MHKKRRLTLRINLFLVSIEAIVCAVILLSIPSDVKNSFLFGYSAFRLGELLIFIIAFCISTWLLTKSYRTYNTTPGFSFIKWESIWLKRLLILLLVSFCFLCFFLLFLPENNMEGYDASYERLKPLIIFIFLFSLQSTLTLMLWEHKPGITQFSHFYKENFKIIYACFTTLILIGLMWLFIALTKIGIEPSQFWEKNGVPILFRQVFFVFLIGIWLVFIQKTLREYPIPILSRLNSRNIDIILFVIIWALTSFVWLREPLPFNAFNPGPFPPNNSYYPYSDAAYYYSFSQWASIGQPLLLVDKPIYSTFLSVLRFLASQDYSAQLALQVVFFAIFPAILYKITKTLTNEITGLLVAIISIIHVKNTIGSSLFLWKVSHPKMMMSEFPTAIMIAVLILTTIYWRKIPDKSTKFAMIVGGIIGISTLVRHNMWLLLPTLLLFIILTHLSQWKKWMTFSFLVLGIMFLAIMPWMLRSSKILGNPFYFMIPLKGTIYENRYLPQIEGQEFDQIEQAEGNDSSHQKPLSIQAALVPQKEETNLKKYGILIRSISSHFLHNIIANAFSLPTQINFENLYNTVTNHNSSSLWNYEWDGEIKTSTSIILFLQLFVFSLGVGIAWARERSTGLIPLLFFFAYNLSTAFANTSGGRYIVPVNWVLFLYLGIGLSACVTQVCSLMGVKSHQRNQKTIVETRPVKTSALAGVIIFFLFLGSTPIISENLFARRYPKLTKFETLHKLLGFQVNTDLDFDGISDFLQSENAVIFEGRALYPRYMDYTDDRARELFSNIAKSDAQLTFQLIGPTTALVTLPMHETPRYFPHESHVFVVGCLYKKDGIDAFVDYELQAFSVFLVEENASIITYNREPMTELACHNNP